tara:strand:- start:967 stop:1701 length:735 start_codon:yes stop_codon:yes gene_type:complete
MKNIIKTIHGVLEYQVLAHLVGLWIVMAGGRVKSRGLLLNVKNNRITTSVKYHLFSNQFEEKEFTLLQKHFLPNFDVVEIGGGIGFLSCYIGQKIEPKTNHIVIEPNPFLLPTIESNRILNKCEFEILNRAYSPTPGFVTLDVSGPFESSRINVTSSDTVQVESINLRKIIDKYKLDQFSLIIDIEGNEFDLLRQEFDILAQHCPFILIEFHNKFGSIQPMISKLENSGYSVFKNQDVYAFIRD